MNCRFEVDILVYSVILEFESMNLICKWLLFIYWVQQIKRDDCLLQQIKIDFARDDVYC